MEHCKQRPSTQLGRCFYVLNQDEQGAGQKVLKIENSLELRHQKR